MCPYSPATAASIHLITPAHSSRFALARTDRQGTDRQTPYHFIDPAPRSMRAVAKRGVLS